MDGSAWSSNMWLPNSLANVGEWYQWGKNPAALCSSTCMDDFSEFCSVGDHLPCHPEVHLFNFLVSKSFVSTSFYLHRLHTWKQTIGRKWTNKLGNENNFGTGTWQYTNKLNKWYTEIRERGKNGATCGLKMFSLSAVFHLLGLSLPCFVSHWLPAV